MKKTGCLWCAVCMLSMPLLAAALQEALERHVLTAEQAQYAAKQEFVMAVERLQFHAKYNDRDQDGFVKGVFEVARAYEKAAKGHSELYAAELYSYLDRRMERPWSWGDRTIASYVLKALKKKAKRAEYSTQRIYNKEIELLEPIHQKRRFYSQLVWRISLVRTNLQKINVDESVARGEVKWENLTPVQEQQIKAALAQLVSLGPSLEEAKPELLQVVTEGLERDPLHTQDGVLELAPFLVRYGMYSSHQADGTQLVRVGHQLLAVQK